MKININLMAKLLIALILICFLGNNFGKSKQNNSFDNYKYNLTNEFENNGKISPPINPCWINKQFRDLEYEYRGQSVHTMHLIYFPTLMINLNL